MHLKKYIKYYFLEDYLLNEVRNNFQKRGYLTPEEFFAIVIWKRNASKTNIRKGVVKSKRTIRAITSRVFQARPEEKLNALLSSKIPGIGIAIASAILTILYPDDFTIADYHASASIKDLGKNIKGDPRTKVAVYNDYLNICKKLAPKHSLSLRDFDRALWAKDFYEGSGGLKHLVAGLK